MTSVAKAASLYEQDFVRWSEEQARALRDASRSGTNLPLDWDNLAEEVESLGTSQRSELRSRIRKIIEHLLKLQCLPAVGPRRGWAETILRERADLRAVLKTSPSLRGEVAGVIAEEMTPVARLTARTLELYDEATPQVLSKLTAARYDEEQVLGDWLPEPSDGA